MDPAVEYSAEPTDSDLPGQQLQPQGVPPHTGRSNNTSAYDQNFVTMLADSVGFPAKQYYPSEGFPKPENASVLESIILQNNPSVSFSQDDFSKFVDLADEATDEDHVNDNLMPIIRGDDSDILSQKNLHSSNLAPLIGKGGLVVDVPDYCDGVRLSSINWKIREDIGIYIQPSKNAEYPALPNFFLEVKGPAGDTMIVKRQAFYDGCMGARGMHQLRSYGKNPSAMYDNKVYTIVSTFAHGRLTMYGVWPTAQIDPERMGDTSYHMSELGRWDLTLPDDMDGFIRGVTAFRNLRDWAKEQRDNLVETSKQTLRSLNIGSSNFRQSSSSHDTIGKDSDTEVDPDEGENRITPTKKQVSTPRSDLQIDSHIERRRVSVSDPMLISSSNSGSESQTQSDPNQSLPLHPSSQRRISSSRSSDSPDELAHPTPRKPKDKRPRIA